MEDWSYNGSVKESSFSNFRSDKIFEIPGILMSQALYDRSNLSFPIRYIILSIFL